MIFPSVLKESAILGGAGRATTFATTVVSVMDEAPRQAAGILVMDHIVLDVEVSQA